MASMWRTARSCWSASLPQLLGAATLRNGHGAVPTSVRTVSHCVTADSVAPRRLDVVPLTTVPSRPASFFTRHSAQDLWKGVISVSNAGKKRGRGKGVGKKTAKNLSRGQVIGVGKSTMIWPGLNSPIVQGMELIQQRRLPDDPEYESRLLKLRDDMSAFNRVRLTPLQRGWSGDKLPGRSIGPPDAVGEDNFAGFDTKVLEFKTVCNMKGNLGRTRRMSAFVITGNGNGLAGFALAKAQAGQAALRKAKNRAAQKLMYVERYNDHTVLHDFYTRFGKTKIFVQKKPEGYGLVCHRAIKTVCEVIGIRDLYAKVEGSTKNVQHVTKAFLVGLIRQKSYQQIADETALHVVERRQECEFFPRVVASPATKPLATRRDAATTSFDLLVMDGKVASPKVRWPRFYERLPSWQNHLSKTLRFRNHEQVRTAMVAEHGEIRSFLAERYGDQCRHIKFVKQARAEEDAY